ncbi:MAG: TonB-dependent receptor [Polyangiaceae bacterium]|nr:TonB-dependent receptor [Polyangiaceae bacterium]
MTRARALALAAVMVSAADAAAQEPVSEPEEQPAAELEAPPDTEPEEPIEVRVVGDRADQIQKIPGSFSVVDKRAIERARPVDAAEMLRTVPGVLVRQDTSGGLRLDIGIRGLDPGRSRRLLVLEDGMPLAINPYAEPDLYFIPQIERYSRIEVLKGSGSILYGPQTIGGVINFSTHLPPDRLESRVSVDAGEFGYVRTLGRFGTAIPTSDDRDPVRVLGQIVSKRGDGARDQSFKDHDGLVKIAIPVGTKGEATIKLAAHRTETMSEDVGMTREMFEADPRRPALSPDSRAELSRLDASITHEHRFTPDVALKTLIYGSLTDRIWTRQGYDRLPRPGTSYERIVGDVDLPLGAIYFRDDARILDRTYWVVGLEPRVTANVHTGPMAHTIDAGLRVLGEGASLDELDGDHKGATEGTLVAAEGHKSIAVAAYAQDRIAVVDELVVTPGLRLEHASYSRSIDLAPGALPASGSSGTTALIPGIGVTAGTPQIHGFGGMHVGFAPPRVTTAIGDQGQTEELEAERSTNWEAGLRARPVPWQKLEVTGFLTRFSNQIVPNTRPGGVTELINGGATQSLGAEMGADAALGEAFSIDHRIDIGARGTLMRATFEEGDLEGQALPSAPVYAISANADVDLAFGVGFGAAVTHVGPHFADDENTLAVDASGRVGEIPGYTLLDVTVRYRDALTGLGASVQAKNLLDDVFVIARRPEGIHTSGYRQIVGSVWWDIK